MITPTLAKEYAPCLEVAVKKGLPPPPVGWFMSEKIQGIRAIWDCEDKTLKTRGGKPINVPESWKSSLPLNVSLDGELFAQNGGQDRTSGLAQKKVSSEEEWDEAGMQYLVFGTYGGLQNAADRLMTCKLAVNSTSALRITSCPEWVIVLPQHIVKSLDHFNEFRTEIESKGGEGVMLLSPEGP